MHGLALGDRRKSENNKYKQHIRINIGMNSESYSTCQAVFIPIMG
jgi:hypothetical protein